MSSLTGVKAVASVERDKLGLALVAAAGPVLRDSPPLVVRVGLERGPALLGRARSGGQCGGRSGRSASSGLVEVGSCSTARGVGRAYTLAGFPEREPGRPDQSVRCDLLVRVLDGGPREPYESACFGPGRILDVLGVPPGHCPGCKVGQRGDVESGIV